MKTAGRGCLYLLVGFAVLLMLSYILGRTITIPWFLFIVLVVLAFWAASRKSK